MPTPDEGSRQLRALEHGTLGPRWMELKVRTAALSDQGVGDYFNTPEPGFQHDFNQFASAVLGRSELRAQAAAWMADAGAWRAAADQLKASGELSEDEGGKLIDVDDQVRARWLILSRAGIDKRSPTAVFLQALPAEIARRARELVADALPWGLLLVGLGILWAFSR